MKDVELILKAKYNSEDNKTNLFIAFPEEQERLTYADTLSLLVNGVVLLIKTAENNEEMGRFVVEKIIEYTNDSNSYSDAKIEFDSTNIISAANVILLNEEGEVLGVSRKDNHSDFGLIGGKMEDIDENNPINTAIRETAEETGLEIYDLKLILVKQFNGVLNFTYLAKFKGDISHNEPHVVKWVPFGEILKGSFGDYNLQVLDILLKLNIIKLNLNLDNKE